MPELRLTLTDYVDEARWRWVLADDQERFLADHTVALDPKSREYGGFLDLKAYLDYGREAFPPEQQLAALGAWIGERVFGGVRETLRNSCDLPATAVHMVVPEAAQDLLFRPFELARFADDEPFADAGVRFVYQLEGAPAPTKRKTPADDAVRILAAFSLPGKLNPLNLRRERHGLQKLVRELVCTHQVAVELRVLQYGATREMLTDALEEAEGWDIVHLSGHGQEGGLLLEDDSGGVDEVDAGHLGDLLAPARQRLKLLILDVCYSGAATHAAARAQIGLETPPTRQDDAEGQTVDEIERTLLPSLAQDLSHRLDCAALAMRYPVGDAFATDLMLSLYGKLLEKRQPLPPRCTSH